MSEEEIKEEQVAQEPAPKKKKKGKKGLVILLVIVGVLLVGGVGMWIWHEQPSFCNAICHTPMDSYWDTYNQDLGVAGKDKWGNDVTNTAGMMAVTHKAEGLACMDCHVPTLAEQVNEGLEWISGNYTLVANPTYGGVLPETTLKKLVEARGSTADEFCMTKGCHEVTRGAELIALTADLSTSRNPHGMPHGDLQCSDCHKAHRASVNQCSSCHNDAPIPDGWLTTIQAKKLPATA